MLKIILTYILTMVLSTIGYSQQLPLTVYANGYGSIQNGAFQVFQDGKGWMWFVSGSSLSRYDGHNFNIIQPSANTVADFIYRVFEIDNQVCLMSKPYPLMLSGDSLIKHPYLPDSIDIISTLKINGTQYLSCTKGLYLLQNKHLRLLIPHTSSGDNRNAVFKFNDSLIIGNFYKGMAFVFNIKRNTVHYHPSYSGKIQKDKSGNLYIHYLDKGIAAIKNIKLNGANCEIQTTLLHPLKNETGGYFVIDDNNNHWAFRSHHWLTKISPDHKSSVYTEADGFPGFVFFDILKDKENNIWLAMSNGVCKITQSQISRFTSSDGIINNHVNEIFITPDGKNILASTEEGTSIFNRNRWQTLLYRNKPLHIDKTIFVKNKQYLLHKKELSEISTDFRNARVIYKKTIDTLPHQPIQMDADTNGNIYITSFKGLYKLDNGKLRSYLDSNKIGHSLLIDSRNRIWLGGFGDGLEGYKIITSTLFHKIHLPPGLSGKHTSLTGIRAIVEDRSGNIIVGTRYNGLFYLQLRNDSIIKYHRLTMHDGLLSNCVRWIVIDKNNAWWLITDNGINIVTGTPGKWMIKNESSTLDITRASSILYGSDSTVWISNYPGVVSINQSEPQVQQAFQVYITQILVNDKKIMPPTTFSKQTLQPRQNDISFIFSANSFTNEKAVLYSYQLSNGDDTSWSAPHNTHQVNYSALRPGTYHFKVKALHPNGHWSDNIAGYSFFIRSPVWWRWWFLLLVAMIVAALLMLLYRFRIGQIKKLQTMRNNISRNLHDDIGSSLTNILILNEMTRKNIDQKDKVGLYLSRAREDIKSISESLSDIVWNIHPGYDDLHNLFIRMKRYAAEMLEGKNIEAEISLPETDQKYSMPMDQRRDFYLLFKEAINNMAKHSGASKASVLIDINHKIVILTIKDNGKGFDVTHAKNGNGLNSIKQRADRWNAILEVKSEPGKGTEVTLKMKI